jgi:hypothetical protein
MEKSTKWLYEFEAKHLIKKDDGAQETVLKKFAILKPNRRLREDGELFYAAETSKFAKAGVLPKAAWSTILSNGGGIISDQDRELYGNLLLKFRDLSFELQSILIKGEADRTETEKKRVDDIISELDGVRNEIQSFESSQIAIFENTAEAKARNRAILWWIMFLSYKKEGDSYAPIFSGETYQDKLVDYDKFEEDEVAHEFILSVTRRMTYLVTLWFLGKAEKHDEFEYFDKNYLKENIEKIEEEKKEIKMEKEIEEIKIEEIKSE